jgi:hypothetical protein
MGKLGEGKEDSEITKQEIIRNGLGPVWVLIPRRSKPQVRQIHQYPLTERRVIFLPEKGS